MKNEPNSISSKNEDDAKIYFKKDTVIRREIRLANKNGKSCFITDLTILDVPENEKMLKERSEKGWKNAVLLTRLENETDDEFKERLYAILDIPYSV